MMTSNTYLVPILKLCLGFSIGLLRAGSAMAQASAGSPVVLAIVEDFPAADSRAILVRFPLSTGSRDMIVLNRAHASPEGLASALTLLRKLRTTQIAPNRVETVTIEGSVLKKPLRLRTRAQLGASLSRLAGQRLSRVGNLGRGQWIELPNDQLDR